MDTFKDQDPFVILEIEARQYKTKTHNNGGKKPVWGEKATFEVLHTAGELKLDIWDEDTFSNDYNAGALIPLKMLC